MLVCNAFFFFKQKTAYEMRISDWSSDVCSSDLTQILTDVAEIIGANILNIARQDYDPQGASVTILISEEPVIDKADAKGVISDAVVAHLDKSHITVHTYPATHPQEGIATFRPDIDVATCGVISPLKALTYLIESIQSDIVIAD